MARLYADENVPVPVVRQLRELGHDVLTVVEDGKGNRRYPDAGPVRHRPRDASVRRGLQVRGAPRKAARRVRATGSPRPYLAMNTYGPPSPFKAAMASGRRAACTSGR